jgi:hypothetical protein
MEDIFVRKLPAVVLAGAVALAGTAFAASPKPVSPQAAGQTHVMNVPLPDGSVARVEYVGAVAPKVSVVPAPMTAAGSPWAMPVMPSFANFDRMIAEMNRQSQAIVRQAQEMARQPAGAAAPYVASYGNLPAGETSTTVVSFSNNGKSCTRTTQVVSQGPGKAPKVTSSATGECDATPATSGGPINRT